MKNKRIIKQGIALLCAVVLLVGGIAIFATNSKAETVAEQLARDGYTRISPEDFGVTEETIYTVDGTEVTSVNKAHKSSTITSIDSKYFEADLSITPASSTNKNVFCYWQKKLFRVYVNKTNVYVYSQQAGKAIVNRPISDFDMTSASEYFNFKIATKVSDNASNSANSDIKVKVWINNIEAKLTTSTITVSDDYVTNLSSTQYPQRIRVDMQETGTVKFRPAMEKTVDIPDTLEGYTKMETTDFGISEEVVHSATSTSQAYAAINISSFHERYLDTDISFAGGQGSSDAALCYMGQDMFRMYIASNTFYVYDYQNSTTLYEKPISDLGISEGEYFHLKWATSINAHSNDSTKSNVSMKIWINDTVVAPLSTVSDTNSTMASVSTAALAQNMTVLTGDTSTATIKIKPTGWEPVVEPVDPNLPSELIGYKKVTPENFGITEEFVYDTVGALYSDGLSKWADVTDFNHAYFDADIALTDTQATNVNAGFGYLNKWMFRFYISGTTLVVYTLQEECAGILYQVNLSEYEITAGEYFNLKFATDITDNTGDSSKSDVKVQMWLNGTKATAQKDTITIGDAYATSNYINMTLAEAGTIKIRPAVVEEPEDPDEPSDPLDGYTKITPENFGITEEVVHTYVDDSINKTHSGTTSMKDRNTYFEADVSLTAAGVDTGYIAYLNQYLLRIYIVGDALTVYTHEGGYEALFQTKLSSLDGTIGEYFHLKFATSMTDNTSDSGKTDITVRMWVNDHEVEPLKTNSNKITVSDAHAGGTNLYVSLSTAGTIKIKPHIEETEEPDVPVVPEEPVDPNLPEELKDYTKVTPQYFGIKKPAMHVYGTNSSGTYTANGTKSFEKAYFEADIALPKAALETGYIGYLNQSLFRFYMTDTTFVIYSPISYTLSKVGVVYQENLSALGIKAGEYFNLKFATSMTDNTSDTAKTDIAMQIWINDTKVTPQVSTITVTDDYTTGQSLFVKLTKAGTIKVKTHVEVSAGQGERLPDVSYRLSSTSGYLLTGSGDLFVDGVSVDVGSTLTMPGDYVIQNVISPDEIYIQNVTLYEVGDVNLGGGDEWTTADQGELERIIKYGTTSTAAKKAADINNDGKVAKSDLTLIKKVVKGELTKEEVLEKYYTPAITYDFLGGNSVMPIGGYYGPYNAQNITENVYKAIAESGINLIVKSEMDYANEDSRALLEKGMGYAEKYKIGVFVYDTRLNKITASNGVVTDHSYVSNASTLGSLLGDYSKYPSYLGNMIVDEPIANIEDGWTNWAENRVDRYKWYEGITTALNAYDNQTGYVNLLGQYHMQQQEGYVYMNYAAYLRAIGKSNKVLSFDSYPFWESATCS